MTLSAISKPHETLRHRIVGQLVVSLSRTPDLGVDNIYWFTRAYTFFPEVELPVPVQLATDVWKGSLWSFLNIGYSYPSHGYTCTLSACSSCLTSEFAPSVLWNNSTKQKTRQKPPNFISIPMHFHYILINKEKRSSHQEILFLVKVTMNGKFSRASVTLCGQNHSNGISALLNSHSEFHFPALPMYVLQISFCLCFPLKQRQSASEMWNLLNRHVVFYK